VCVCASVNTGKHVCICVRAGDHLGTLTQTSWISHGHVNEGRASKCAYALLDAHR